MCLQAVSILRCAVAVGEGFSRPSLISEGPPLSLFDLLLQQERVRELDVPLVGWASYVVHLSSWMWVLPFLFLIFLALFFWVLWFIYGWQGFIIKDKKY
jgi:hypothetical protein